jgi:hypothetical protein
LKRYGTVPAGVAKKPKNHFGFLVLLIKTTMTDGFIQLKPWFFANSTCDEMTTSLSIFLKNHAPFSVFLVQTLKPGFGFSKVWFFGFIQLLL